MSCLLCELLLILQNWAVEEVGRSLPSVCLQVNTNTAQLCTQSSISLLLAAGRAEIVFEEHWKAEA